MRVEAIEITDGLRTENAVRLSARVSYDNGVTAPETYWLEVPREISTHLTAAGDPWLAWLAPLAASLGEPLHLSASVDQTLLDNIREVVRIWCAWYPHLRIVPIEAPIRNPPGDVDAGHAAAFFSGGVDSFFTVLRHADQHGTPTSHDIRDLLFIHGFDIPLDNTAAFERVRHSLAGAASRLGKRLVTVATNLRETRFATLDWEQLTHGAALAGVALALGSGYRRVLIPSSAGYRDLRFWGSHPLTDPLFSTSTTQIVHDGPAFMRAEKTEYVAQFDVVMDTLRVCWRSEAGDNCGACNNCYRTMLTLEVLDALDRSATFDAAKLDLRKAAKIYCPNTWDVRQFGYVRDLALRRGREDIARAVEQSLRGSARLTRLLRLFDGWAKRRLLWRATNTLRRRALAGWMM